MESLPIELFIHIISFLPISDKLQYIRVSKKWHRYITEMNLHEKVEFKGSLHKFRQAFKYFNERRYMGKHVRHLVMYQKYIDTNDILLLPTLFPNAKTIEWTESSDGIYCDPNKIISTKWKHLKKLTYLPQYHHNMPCLFKCFTFPNLEHIEVNFGFNHDASIVQSMVRMLLKELHKAPLLDRLILKRASISLNDMEEIYNALPKLREIKLVPAYLSAEKTEVLVKTPASQLRSLHMEYYEEEEKFEDSSANPTFTEAKYRHTIINWINYIGKKFKNIQHLHILHYREGNSNTYAYDGIERDLESTLCNIMPNIESYKIAY